MMAESNWNINPIFSGSPVRGDTGAGPDGGSPLLASLPTMPTTTTTATMTTHRANPVFFPLESTIAEAHEVAPAPAAPAAAAPAVAAPAAVVPAVSLMGTGGGAPSVGVDTGAGGGMYGLDGGTLGHSRGTQAQGTQGHHMQGLSSTHASRYANQSRIKSSLGADHPEESRFEEILRRLLTHEMSLAEGVKAFRDISVLRSAQLQELAVASGDPSSPMYMKLSQDAEELRTEGKTWSLLYYVFARDAEDHDMSYPAGTGGYFVDGAGMHKTLRQHAVDMVFQDEVLNRAARVVAWLEEERGRDDVDPAQGLGRKDGVWKETRMGLEGNHTDDTMVRRLDPDCMVRDDGALHKDNAKDEERLAKVLWRLLRSGRLHQAAQVCHYVGQPWRAVSLTGYGKYGPLPVGEAAEEADGNETGALQHETLAGEVENMECRVDNKLLWRWACYKASCAIAERVEGAGHGRYESAMYGVLSGDLEHAMMGCTSWEDSMWVVMRCWLEYQIDVELLNAGAEDEDAMDEGEHNEFPIPAVAEQMPEDLPAAVRKGAAAFGGIESVERTTRFRKVQVDLILGDMDSLVEALIGWIVPGGSPEEAQDCPPGLMRFSAHLALLLWRMNLIRIVDENGSLLGDSTNNGLQKLLWIYVIHLIDSASYELVPTYVVHLRKGLRRTTMQLLLEQATYHERIEVRKSVRARCDQWLENYVGVEGIEADEMWTATQTFCDKAMRSSFGGPLTRAESISWMFFDAKNRAEAIAAAVSLCRDFALSGIRGALAGLHLLREVIPSSIEEESGVNALQSKELATWEVYFEIIREFSIWQEVFSDLAMQAQEHPDDRACDEAITELYPDTEKLLEGVMALFKVSSGSAWIEAAEDIKDIDGTDLQATIVLAPAVSDRPSDDSSMYPEYSDTTLAEACAALRSACAALPRSQSEAMDYVVGPASDIAPTGSDLPGLVCIKATAAKGVEKHHFEAAAAALFCSILRNRALNVEATNMLSSRAVSSMICQDTVMPALVLQIATLWEALAFMGQGDRTEAMTHAEAIIANATEVTEHRGQGWTEDDLKLLRDLEESGKSLLST